MSDREDILFSALCRLLSVAEPMDGIEPLRVACEQARKAMAEAREKAEEVNPNQITVSYPHRCKSPLHVGCQQGGALCISSEWTEEGGTVEIWEKGSWDPKLYPVLEKSPFEIWGQL